MNITQASYLKSHGYSATKPRLALLEYLGSAHQATAKDIIQALGDVADQASVYRSLTTLQNIGAISVHMRNGQKCYELSAGLTLHHHHHLNCLECKQTKSFLDPDLEAAIEQAARRNGLTTRTHQLEISGVCRGCQR